MSEYVPKELGEEVARRANHCCEYCYSQARFSTQSFNIDHIYPVSLGGQTVIENLALACPGCNAYKGIRLQGIDTVTNRSAALYNPRTDNWQSHFIWSNDYKIITGITPVGRATTYVLRLNRTPLINLRTIQYEMGEHPPEMV